MDLAPSTIRSNYEEIVLCACGSSQDNLQWQKSSMNNMEASRKDPAKPFAFPS